LYGTATQEIRKCLEEMDRGIPSVPVLSLSLRDREEYLFGTYANQVAVPSQSMKIFSEELPTPLYEAAGTRNDISAVEHRLLRAKVLIPKTQALIELDRMKRIHSIIFSGRNANYQRELDKRENRLARKKFGDALRANSAFKNLIDRKSTGQDMPKLIQQGWMVISTGQREFTREHADWLFQGGEGKTSSIRDIIRPENMYLRDEISVEESMKVGDIPLRVMYSRRTQTYHTTTRVGLYQINKSMLEWSQQVGDKLREAALIKKPIPRHLVTHILSKDREWVNDDTLIISECIKDTSGRDDRTEVLLVSTDKRLANQLCQTCNVIVVLVDPISLPGCFPNRIWNSASTITVEEAFEKYPQNMKVFRKIPFKVYIDTGSVLAHLHNVEKTQVKTAKGEETFFVRRVPISSGINSEGKRFAQYRHESIAATTTFRVKIYDPRSLRKYGTRYKPVPFFPSKSDKYRWSDGSWSQSTETED
jgi:hypothetical protein